MKSARFVCSFFVLVLAAAMIMIASAQSNSAAHANRRSASQASAFFDSQPSSAGVSPQFTPAGQRPQVRFAPAVTYNTGGLWAFGVAIGDLNGDGIPDLVVVNGYENGGNSKDGFVGVLLGNGDGTFQNAVSYDTGGLYSGSVAIGDVNGDGYLDVVVSNLLSSSVSVLLGNGDGTLQAPLSYNVGDEPYSVSLADLRSDGRLDIVAASANSMNVLLGNGDGTFQAPLNCCGGSEGSFAIGDVNGDGHPDLVLTAQEQVAVALGNGDGTFQAPVYYDSGGVVGQGVAIGDVNGDGYPDLAVVSSYKLNCPPNGVCGGSVGVLLGNGDGTFQAAVPYGSHGYYPDSIAIADMNGDGYPDLVVANTCQQVDPYGDCIGSPEVTVLINNGDGTFPYHSDFITGGNYSWDYGAAIADVNLDGRPDIVAVNWNENNPNTAGVLLNSLTYKTSTMLTSSPNPSQVSQTVTLTATISSTQEIPDGQVVTFYSGKAKLGTATATNGVASLTTSFSKAGKYTIKASYAGGGFLGASFGTVRQVVDR